MPRSRILDFLSGSYFWAFDATSDGVPVFNPLFGFSKITAPQISTEVETFKDGTFLYNRTIVKGGSVSSVTFERAASMFDSDFYDWIMFTLNGYQEGQADNGTKLGRFANVFTGGSRESPRRNIIVVQFTKINIGLAQAISDATFRNDDSRTARAAAVTSAAAVSTAFVKGLGSTGLQISSLATLLTAGIGPFQFATRIPARAWVLYNCIPIRYKVGSDFDASNASISLQELEVQPEYIDEFSLGIKP